MYPAKRWTKKVALKFRQAFTLGGNSLNYPPAGCSRAGYYCAGYHRTRYTSKHDLKMTKFSIPPSFEPTESLKHNHTPKKAAMPQRLQDCLSRGGALTRW